MDKYVYPLAGLLPSLSAIYMLRLRPDLAKAAAVYGTIGGVVLIFADHFFYLRDYWHPPSVFGSDPFLEDFLFGFGISTFPFLIYPVVRRKSFVSIGDRYHVTVMPLFGCISLGFLIVGSRILGWNSILVSCCLLAGFTATICAVRTDLIVAATLAIVSLTSLSFALYLSLFGHIAPHWWPEYWLLDHSALGIMILGHVPLLEVLCYATWAGLAATGHPFIFGLRFATLSRPSPKYQRLKRCSAGVRNTSASRGYRNTWSVD